MPVCAPFDPLGRYVGSVLAWVDCRVLGLGEEAFRALGPGSPFGLALTGLLTIYVALIGYRLLLGGDLTVREGMLAAVKIGLVLALATQWPAWRVLVYDVATRTPEAAAASFLRASSLNNGGSEMLAARIDGASAALAQLVETGTVAAAGQPPRPAATVLSEPARQSASAAISTLTVTALAGLVSVRVVMGFLLVLGPALIAALLFEATRGLFLGWLRAVIGTLFAAMAVPAALALQIAIVEPQVRALQALLDAAQPVGALPQQIEGTALVFGFVVLALLAAAACIGLGLAWPRQRLADLARPVERHAGEPVRPFGSADTVPSRPQQIAAAAALLSQREERLGTASAAPRRMALPHQSANATEAMPQFAAIPLGQAGRRVVQRQSLGARRRDDMK